MWIKQYTEVLLNTLFVLHLISKWNDAYQKASPMKVWIVLS